MVIEKIKKNMELMDGVLKIERLSNEDIKEIIDIESNHDNELIPVINEGVKECFRRDFSLVLFKNSHFRNPTNPTLILTTEDGRILGHDIFSKKEKEELKNNKDAYFLSDDFVIYKENLESKDFNPKKQYFILPPVEFSELDNIEMIDNVISSSPSAQSDFYLKKKYNLPEDPKIASIIVSFSLKK
ncbi:hypothetical protein MARBORIA2_03950 [Methanobrevibacter arboriphilus]|jgi:hypothetical protein|uniref:Uncharacterized protein n=2 Tax=Methanobrevibacter arboriphilus TaxID=39441 RepID=A0ACA8R174_METAZ|nr:hypothetical protein [Methanobrevibacter arboriphilus]MCC7562815.1 hypothetical protein [Methanobrevibacter arboriphilus]BBL61361.1 hypothetical protein MarbSA_04010 [Methanobrevibacter arboriphilus]GLI11305.1 hypothetical protein MARBORIA2_03950 [Methanobrevibacter arboriphilus]